MVRRDARGLRQVLDQVALVVSDDHATPAQNIARAHEQGVSDARGHLAGLVGRVGHAGGRIVDAQLVEQRRETLAVLCQVDGLGFRAHDLDALVLQSLRELERRLAAQGDDHAVGSLGVDDVHDVFVGDGLEVEAVGGVVVGRDGLGVAVHHDGLVAQRRQRVARMHAAVVELDALADAVGAGTDNHRLLFGAGRNFRLLVVGLVVVARLAGKLGRAGIHSLEDANDAQTFSSRAHGLLVALREMCNLHVGQAIALA